MKIGKTRALKANKSKSRKISAKRPTEGVTSLKKFSMTTDKQSLHYQANSGQRMYVRQINERKKSYHDLLVKFKKRNNSITNIFKPSINPHSKFILEEKSYRSLERELGQINTTNFGSFTCRNLNEDNSSRDRLLERSKDEYIKMKQEIVDKECTFKPQLNRVTKKIVKSKRVGSNSSLRSNSGSKNEEVFSKLYEDSKEHKKKINKIAQSMLKSSDINNKKSLNTSRSTKLKDFELKRQSFLKNLQCKRKDHCKTSLIATKPTRKSIGTKANKSNSRTRSRSGGKSVHEDLYIDSKVRQQRIVDDKCRQIYQERKSKFNRYLNKKPTNYAVRHRSKSRKIMQKVKIQRCTDLFQKLDNDQDGYISSQKIDILGVSNDIIDLITPLLLRIEQKELILDYSQFYDILDKFSKNLTIDQKNLLFGPTKQLTSRDVMNTFRPRINSKSMHICESIEKSTDKKRIGEMANERKVWKEAHLKAKEIKDKSEISK